MTAVPMAAATRRLSRALIFLSCARPIAPAITGTLVSRLSSPSSYFSYHILNRHPCNPLIHSRCWFANHTPAAGVEDSAVVDVPLAQTGEGIAECELLQWFVAEGEDVDEFQKLCEVQSDKATMEITSRVKGKIHRICYVPGDVVKVGETLLKILVGEAALECHDNTDSHSSELQWKDTEHTLDAMQGVLATPSVRHLAKQYGLNINELSGTGKDGRILMEDVLNYASRKNAPKETHSETDYQLNEHDYIDKTIPLRGFQRSMVKSMSLAARVPHFHYLEEVNCEALVELKATFQMEHNEGNVKHTFLPFLIKSLSLSLSKYPMLNSSFIEETTEVTLKGFHNIGIAMATQYGLVVPNVKRVQLLSVLEITKELCRLQHLASSNKLSTEDITGGTITLSNIGAVGGKFGSPLLNLPEVAIIALGRIQKLPRFDDDGTIYPASVMNVTVGADHRVVDGATVSRFCNEWKRLIEKPELLLLHLR